MTFNDATIKRFVSIIKTKIHELENTIEQKLFSHPLLENFNSRSLTIDSIKKYIKKEVKEAKSLLKGVMISTYKADDNIDKLSKFWMPDGKTPNADNQKKLAAELAKEGTAEDELPTVINFPEFKPLRAELVKALGL